ncbi:MAG: hypothetical protein KDA72_12345 [Planctomycetales bacterium]|nr:hypothetical protein [Planctomycetales bacterium]
MTNPNPRGPWFHRFLIWLFAIGVSVLSFWLLGYIVRDIDAIQGPDYQAMEASMLDAAIVDRRKALADEIDDAKRSVANLNERRLLLQNTISTSQQTMHQLLDLQRLSMEKGAQLSDEQESALTENLDLFLANQTQAQEFNAQLSELNLKLQGLQAQADDMEAVVNLAKQPILEAFDAALRDHRWRLGIYKLAVLLPLLLISTFLFIRKSAGNYAALVYATGVALAARVLFVMHEHFPAIYFKYILIVVSLIIAIAILIRLLRTVANPRGDWLLKQYREAYTNFLCPICEFPIRRGPLRFVSWTPRSLRRLLARSSLGESATGEDKPYTCPSCSTELFKTCPRCEATRYALLPACDKCGAIES